MNGTPATPSTSGRETRSSAELEGLRWSARPYYREAWRQEHAVFQCALLTPEHLSVFSRFAQALCALPESAWNGGAAWTQTISPQADAFILELDRLHAELPACALRIAAIVAAISSQRDLLAEEALRRVCDWLSHPSLPMGERVALGQVIHETWPENNAPPALAVTVLALFVQASAEVPDQVAQLCRPRWAQRGAGTHYVVSILDDPASLLTIGRHLKAIEPGFCKNVFCNYLFSGRIGHRGFAPSEQELRTVALEYYELETVMAPSEPSQQGRHCFNLSQWAFLDTDWYPDVLQRLFSAAQACAHPAQAAAWFRMVAMHAQRQSALFGQALEAFARYVQSDQKPSEVVDRWSTGFAEFILESIDITTKARVLNGRNIGLPPDPQHPVAEAATQALWKLVSWASDLPSSEVLLILVLAVEQLEEASAQHAAAQMRGLFDAKARQDPDGAAVALGQLARNAWYSDADTTRKTRCMGLVGELLPVLQSISPSAAAQAQSAGQNTMWSR